MRGPQNRSSVAARPDGPSPLLRRQRASGASKNLRLEMNESRRATAARTQALAAEEKVEIQLLWLGASDEERAEEVEEILRVGAAVVVEVRTRLAGEKDPQEVEEVLRIRGAV